MTPSQHDVLGALASGPARRRELQALTGRDERTIRRATDSLIASNLVKKIDGPVLSFEITQGGREALAAHGSPTPATHGRPTQPPTPSVARQDSAKSFKGNEVKSGGSGPAHDDSTHGPPMGGGLTLTREEATTLARVLARALARNAELEERVSESKSVESESSWQSERFESGRADSATSASSLPSGSDLNQSPKTPTKDGGSVASASAQEIPENTSAARGSTPPTSPVTSQTQSSPLSDATAEVEPVARRLGEACNPPATQQEIEEAAIEETHEDDKGKRAQKKPGIANPRAWALSKIPDLRLDGNRARRMAARRRERLASEAATVLRSKEALVLKEAEKATEAERAKHFLTAREQLKAINALGPEQRQDLQDQASEQLVEEGVKPSMARWSADLQARMWAILESRAALRGVKT